MGKKKHKAGLPPGTPVFTGKKYLDEPNVVLMQYGIEECRESSLQARLPEPLEGDWNTWYDVRGVHDLELMKVLGERFRIHPLALEDIVDTHQRPKMEDFVEGVFLTFRALSFQAETLQIETEQISLYFGEKFLLSFQEKEEDLWKPIRERLRGNGSRIRKRGVDYLAYALVDLVVDHYYIVLDQVEDEIERLEARVLSGEDPAVKGAIYQLKLQLLHMRRSISPLREAVGQFAKTENRLVKSTTRVFVRDLYDHTVHVLDSVDTFRDMANSLYDLHLSELSQRMNAVIQVLTIITTLFVPLTFIVGVYGMNFEYMPELKWRYGYFAVWGVMVLLSIAMLFFFRKRRWI